jgi:hypothetical protein
MDEHTILVAFTVEGESMRDAQESLMRRLVPQLQSRDLSSPVIEWWIAEDERYDGSDLESAVFIPGDYPSVVSKTMARKILETANRAYGYAEGGEDG